MAMPTIKFREVCYSLMPNRGGLNSWGAGKFFDN